MKLCETHVVEVRQRAKEAGISTSPSKAFLEGVNTLSCSMQGSACPICEEDSDYWVENRAGIGWLQIRDVRGLRP